MAAAVSDRKAFSVSIYCVRKNGTVLLIRHERLGLWLPLGGEIKEGERPIDAARRECEEESGLIPEFVPTPNTMHGTPNGFLAYEEHTAGSKGLHMNFAFMANVSNSPPFSDGSWTYDWWVNPLAAQGDKSGEIPRNVRDLLWLIACIQRRHDPT